MFHHGGPSREEEHKHDFFELVFISEGQGDHEVNASIFEVRKGDLLFMNPGDRHAFRSSYGMDFVNLLVVPRFISEHLVTVDNAADFFSLRIFRDFAGVVPCPRIRFAGKTTDEPAAHIGVQVRFRCFVNI